MNYVGCRQFLWLYHLTMQEFGGSEGVRDEGLLQAALARPRATFAGQELYPTLFEKAAAVAESIARNHPLVDGNKRMALVAMVATLSMNGYELTASDNAQVDLIMCIVAKEVTVQDVSDWLSKHTRRL